MVFLWFPFDTKRATGLSMGSESHRGRRASAHGSDWQTPSETMALELLLVRKKMDGAGQRQPDGRCGFSKSPKSQVVCSGLWAGFFRNWLALRIS